MKKLLAKCSRMKIDKDIVSFVSTDDKKRIDISYYFNSSNKHVYAEVYFGKLAQGPPGFVHGGAIAAVLDETMGITGWMNNYKVMTLVLKTGFLKALKLNSTVYVDAWIDKTTERNVFIKSSMISEDKSIVFANAEGTFAVIDKEKWDAFGIDADKFVSKDYLE